MGRRSVIKADEQKREKQTRVSCSLQNGKTLNKALSYSESLEKSQEEVNLGPTVEYRWIKESEPPYIPFASLALKAWYLDWKK